MADGPGAEASADIGFIDAVGVVEIGFVGRGGIGGRVVGISVLVFGGVFGEDGGDGVEAAAGVSALKVGAPAGTAPVKNIQSTSHVAKFK